MKQYPEPVVGAFIMNAKGELFLMKSHKWKDKYVVPGGHIELGETIDAALKREVKEETNLDIADPQFICIYELISENTFYEKRHMIFLNYKAQAYSSEVKLNDEAEEYTWVTPPEALKLPLEKYTQLTIKNYLLKNLV